MRSPIRGRSRLLVFLVGVGFMSLLAAGPVAATAKDGHGEVRAAGVCGGRASAELRLRRDNAAIELRFKVEHSRSRSVWRIALVHERRIAWKGVASARSDGSFEVRRTLPDLPGADAVTAHAWGPQGLVCRAAATLTAS
jgi:hypothetical protein